MSKEKMKKRKTIKERMKNFIKTNQDSKSIEYNVAEWNMNKVDLFKEVAKELRKEVGENFEDFKDFLAQEDMKKLMGDIRNRDKILMLFDKKNSADCLRILTMAQAEIIKQIAGNNFDKFKKLKEHLIKTSSNFLDVIGGNDGEKYQKNQEHWWSMNVVAYLEEDRDDQEGA